MDNLFDTIQGKPSYRPVSTLLVKHPKPQSQAVSLVLQWKKSPSPQNTRKVLQYLKPTIQSALHSYVPGQQAQFRLKATSLSLQALKNYDGKKAAPATFVFTNLQRLNRIRRDRQTPIHIPESQVYAKQQLDKKVTELEESLGRSPTQEQICDFTGISRKKLQKLQEGNATVSQSAAADAQTGADLIGSKQLTDRDFYNYVYDSVPPIDKKIMQWSAGFNKAPLSNNQIASRLHMSPGAISQHKNKIQQLLGQVRGLL